MSMWFNSNHADTGWLTADWRSRYCAADTQHGEPGLQSCDRAGHFSKAACAGWHPRRQLSRALGQTIQGSGCAAPHSAGMLYPSAAGRTVQRYTIGNQDSSEPSRVLIGAIQNWAGDHGKLHPGTADMLRVSLRSELLHQYAIRSVSRCQASWTLAPNMIGNEKEDSVER